MIRGSNASKETGFSLWQNIPNRSSSLVPEFLSVDKASGAWIWPLVSAQVKNECKCTFTRSRWFHVVERENFTFFIPFLSYLSFTFLLPFLYLSFTFCNASSFFLLLLLSFFLFVCSYDIRVYPPVCYEITNHRRFYFYASLYPLCTTVDIASFFPQSVCGLEKLSNHWTDFHQILIWRIQLAVVHLLFVSENND